MVEFWPPIGLRIKTIIISYQKFDTVNVVKMTRNKFGKNTLTGDIWIYWLNVTFCRFFSVFFSEGVRIKSLGKLLKRRDCHSDVAFNCPIYVDFHTTKLDFYV